MAVLASNQQTVVDLTDAYNVILTSEAHTFVGTTGAAKAGSCVTQVVAMRGSEQVACSVGTITCPAGVTASSDGDATAPTITINATTSLKAAGEVIIPVTVGEVNINKRFSVAVAFAGATGATGKGINGTPAITYQAGTSGTTAPTGTWSASVPSVAEGQYLWTKTVTTYTDNSTSTAYSVAKQGAKGSTGAAGKGISSTAIAYQKSASGTTVPTGSWSSSPVAADNSNRYVWTRTVTTFTDGSTTTAYSVGMKGDTGATGAAGAKGEKGDRGAAGADAVTMAVTSSNGFIFKNTDVVTVLTAHVYRAGTELTSSQVAQLGTIKWYKDGSTTAVKTGATLSIAAGDVTDKASYTAQLEA